MRTMRPCHAWIASRSCSEGAPPVLLASFARNTARVSLQCAIGPSLEATGLVPLWECPLVPMRGGKATGLNSWKSDHYSVVDVLQGTGVLAIATALRGSQMAQRKVA